MYHIHHQWKNVVPTPAREYARDESSVHSVRLSDSEDQRTPLYSWEERDVSIDNAKNHGILNMDSSVLYTFETNEADLVIEAADYFMKNKTDITPLKDALLYNAFKSRETELSKLYPQYAARVEPFFPLFMTVILDGHNNSSQ